MRLPRAAGILMHPTSLPGPRGSGDFGADAYRFVDWLEAAGQSYWQILPLGGVGPGHSPYMCPSAFAGNELLIDLAELAQHGWLDESDIEFDPNAPARHIDFETLIPFRFARLERAAQGFAAGASTEQRAEFDAFCARHADWLDDYALFMTLSRHYPGQYWCDWDEALAKRDPDALAAATADNAGQIAFWKFCQWYFFRQWTALRAYANQHDIRIIGDTPIFIAYHSVEAWVRPELFEFDADGRPTVVAGVPPDYFSETGQRWGNPLYRWEAHQQQGFAWWIERIRHGLEMVDILRIDHFIGFTRYWEIPADEPTAMHGSWRQVPGEALFEALAAALGPVPIIAEDLGLVTPEVHALRRQFDLPGMCVLQFAWGPDGDKNFLPHNHRPDSVVYTGTHDNDTTLGWWQGTGDTERHHLCDYLASDGKLVSRDLLRCALASVADTAIVPIQDVLNLDGAHRMNHPGTTQGNWRWRLEWADIDEDLASRLAAQCRLYGRERDSS